MTTWTASKLVFSAGVVLLTMASPWVLAQLNDRGGGVGGRGGGGKGGTVHSPPSLVTPYPHLQLFLVLRRLRVSGKLRFLREVPQHHRPPRPLVVPP